MNRIKTFERSISSNSTIINSRGHFQKQQDKTTGILVAIILVFVLCHIFRLTIQVYNKNENKVDAVDHENKAT